MLPALLLGLGMVVVNAPPAAAATISPTRSASDLAAALSDPLGPGVLTGSSLPVIPPAPDSSIECANGVDDDGDGFVDFTPPAGETADPGCVSATDNLEQEDFPPECANEFDDDGDGLTDFTPPAGETADPGCTSGTDNNEVEGEPDPVPACANGDDDDGDGLIDFTPPAGETADPGCTSATDLDEGSEGLPPGADSNPAAVTSSPLAGFPTSGGTFTMLSSGSTLFADDPNDSDSTSQGNGGGDGGHGSSFEDVVTLRLDVSVPAGANCLALDFRFLSEEFPEFVGSSYNDGFIAELDASDFTASQDLTIVAPRNFAFDANGEVVSINTAGFSAEEAAGTTYDGATPLLRASTPVTPGPHSVFLSTFDQGDSSLDSTVIMDNLRIFSAPTGGCQAGATDDLTPPDTTITAGPTGVTDDSTPTFSFTSTEAGTFQCRVDGGAWVSCTTPYTTDPLADGAHTFDVRAIDLAGNVDASPATRSFTVTTVDTTPPDTTLTGGPSGVTNDNTPTFTFTSEAGATFECRIDGGSWVGCTSPHTTATLTDGAHTFEVRATDAAGNTDQTPASRTFTVDTSDTTPPDTALTGGPSGVTNDNTPTFTFTSEAGATFECRIDGGAWTSCTSPHTTATLTDATHTFDVRATDAAGNTDPTPASRTFTVDTTPPDTTITAGPGSTTDTTPTFEFTGTAGTVSFECRVDGGAWAACTSPRTTTALGLGTHSFDVRAIDGVGNTDSTPASRTFTVTAPPPPPPPPPPTYTCAGKVATIVGTSGPDVLTGTGGSDVIVALAGNDKISGGGGNDVICGGDGRDVIDGAAGKDRLDGGTGKDKLVGGGGADELDGGDDDDRLLGNGGDDDLDGGTGDDDLAGAAGKDTLRGRAGDDILEAGGGNDDLTGHAGDDRLDGGPGRDRGNGGTGQDVILRCEQT